MSENNNEGSIHRKAFKISTIIGVILQLLVTIIIVTNEVITTLHMKLIFIGMFVIVVICYSTLTYIFAYFYLRDK